MSTSVRRLRCRLGGEATSAASGPATGAMAAICYSGYVKDLSKKYLSTTDAAILAGVTARHLVRLICEGKIVGQKVGRNWLVLRESAEGFSRHPSMGRPKSPRKKA